jgi:chromodomain-helicase-DNA-binding protein 1
VREYEENRRQMLAQQEIISTMPVKEGFGYEDSPIPLPAASSSVSHRYRSTAADSPGVALVSAGPDKGKAKRRKTPEYTDSDEESSQSVEASRSLGGADSLYSSSMDEDACKELLRPVKKQLV